MNQYIKADTIIQVDYNDLVYCGYSITPNVPYHKNKSAILILNKNEILQKFKEMGNALNLKIVMDCIFIIDYNYFYGTVEIYAKSAFLNLNILPNDKYCDNWRKFDHSPDNDDDYYYHNYYHFCEEGINVLSIHGLIKIYPHYQNDAIDYICSNRSYLSIDHFNNFKNHFDHFMFVDKQDYIKKLEDIIKNKLGTKQSYKIFKADEKYKEELRQIIEKLQK